MSRLSEGWEHATDLQKGLGLTASLFIIGLTGAEGREGFEEGIIPGVGRAVGSGAFKVLGIPVTFLKSLAEGLGLFKLPAELKELKQEAEKAGITGEDLGGLVSKITSAGEKKERQVISKMVWIVLGLVGAFAASLLVFLAVRK